MEEAIKGLASMVGLGFTSAGALMKAFHKRSGKEALPVIAEVMGEAGAKMAKVSGTVKSMKDVGEQLKTLMPTLGGELEILSLSDDEIHLRGSPCFFGLEGSTKELCEAAMDFDRGWMKALFGQEVDVKIPKSRAAGDEYCEVIYSKK